MRWTATAVVVTAVALLAGMNVGGGGVDLFGLYALALLLNVVGTTWAAGVAMRFRSQQAGPIMEMPVFLALFFAPVCVPLNLLAGWIHGVASANPVTPMLEAGRSLLAGTPSHVALAFAIVAGLSCAFVF